ncbi:signal peptidase I [Actinomyces qiguomingii]|uniref:signal peptidase I n=1 Tax=Actinomyces qiguomingii TaxID=2057800 RepID=UPI000CA0197E|nr:signal peptidase I [Actinomyces qiguomingii]
MTVAARVTETLAATAVVVGVMLLALVPAITGWVPLVVLTASMSPGMPPGSLLVVESLNRERAAHLEIGDVAAYLPTADSDVLVTHRVVGMAAGADGSVTYSFQGDANSRPDPEPVRPEQIRGLRRYHVPVLGRVLAVLSPDGKRVGRMVLVTGLALYAVSQLAAAIWERRKRRAGGAPSSVSGNTAR